MDEAMTHLTPDEERILKIANGDRDALSTMYLQHKGAVFGFALSMLHDRERAERLLLLGDILYHGPRNDLPEEYDPKGVIRMLNERKRDILCVRGNCDSEVDQMVQQSLSKALKYGATDRL